MKIQIIQTFHKVDEIEIDDTLDLDSPEVRDLILSKANKLCQEITGTMLVSSGEFTWETTDVYSLAVDPENPEEIYFEWRFDV